MAFRFRRSIKIAPGLRVNFGKTGVSLSAGMRGASVTVGPRGRYGNVGIPGTGLSYRSSIDGGSQHRQLAREQQRQEAPANVNLTLDRESGAIQIQNAFGESLSRGDLKLLWDQKGGTILEWLEQQAEEINGDVELLLKIHEDTPSPDSEPDYQILPFNETPPGQPKPPEKRLKPELVSLPPLNFFAKLFKGKRAAHAEKQQQLSVDHKKQVLAWEEYNKRENDRYQDELKRYNDATERWEIRKLKHETNEKKKSQEFSAMLRTDPDVMERILADALNSLSWPRETIVSYQTEDNGRQVWLDVDLPEIEDLPRKLASVSSAGKKLNIKDKSQKQLQLEYATHIFGIAFRLAGTVFATLPSTELSIISGYSQRLDRSTGKISDEYLFSTKVDREGYCKIDFNSLDKVNPVDAMRTFENRCKLTSTGIFKVIEPFQPDGK